MIAHSLYSLDNKIVIITGAAGLMADQHIDVVLENGGIPILIDKNKAQLKKKVNVLKKRYKNKKIFHFFGDICSEKFISRVAEKVFKKYKRLDVLINNAAIDYKLANNSKKNNKLMLENFDLSIWKRDLDVSLKGSLICTKIFSKFMKKNKYGVILNIASDLGLIAPDNRIYNNGKKIRIVKPVSYSVSKHGIIGLTRYTASYFAKENIRCNAIAPGGIKNRQDKNFLKKIHKLIPLGRLAENYEYKGAILFLISEASSYMTGSVLTLDGGRTVI